MHNTYFKYLPKERKVIHSLKIQIPEKLQQQLDYIANAIHDTGFTPNVEFFNYDYGRLFSLNIKYKYEGKKQAIYFRVDLHTLDIDDTIVTIVLPRNSFSEVMHSSPCSLFEKVSQRYFINLMVESTWVNYMFSIGHRKFDSPTILLLKGLHLTKIKWISFCNDTPTKMAIEEFQKFFGKNIKEMLPKLEKIAISGVIIDKDCELLSKLISDGSFAGNIITIVLGNTPRHNLYDFHTVFTDNGVLKLISACKSKGNGMIYLNLCSRKMSSNTQDKLNELNNSINNTIKLMTSLVRESINYKQKEFEQIVKKEFLQILKEDTFELFFKLQNNPKIHKKISEKLNPDIKDNTAYAQKNAQTTVKTALMKASIVIVNEYILPDIEDIKTLKNLPPKVEYLVRFTKLPPELQQHILQFVGSKIFSSCFSGKELQEINDLKEIVILLNKIKTIAAADCTQQNELSQLLRQFKSLPPELQKCVKDNIKSLVFDEKIAARFISTDTESPYNLLKSTVNEAEALLSKLQEQTTDGSAEAAISDNVSACNVVDINNTIDQLIEDLSLVGNDKNHDSL